MQKKRKTPLNFEAWKKKNIVATAGTLLSTPAGGYFYHGMADSILRNDPSNFKEEYDNTFLEGYYDALLENYDVLNEAEKSKLKKFLKKHKKKLIAGAALLGTAGAAVGGGIALNNHVNYKTGKKVFNTLGIDGEEFNKLNKKNVRDVGKITRTGKKVLKREGVTKEQMAQAAGMIKMASPLIQSQIQNARQQQEED